MFFLLVDGLLVVMHNKITSQKTSTKINYISFILNNTNRTVFLNTNFTTVLLCTCYSYYTITLKVLSVLPIALTFIKSTTIILQLSLMSSTRHIHITLVVYLSLVLRTPCSPAAATAVVILAHILKQLERQTVALEPEWEFLALM